MFKEVFNKLSSKLKCLVEKINKSRFVSVLKVVLKEKETKKDENIYIAIILQLVFSFVLDFIIEALSRHSFAEGINYVTNQTSVLLYNSIYIFVTSLLVFLFRKRRFWRFVIFGLWLAAGSTNAVILSNRVTPFTGPDFKNLAEAAAVIKKYFNTTQIVGLVVIATIVVIFLLIYIFRCPRYKGKMRYYISVPLIALAFLGLNKYTNYCVEEKILSTYFSNIAFAYEDYGFPYCFTVTILDTGISEPNDYSKEVIDGIVQESKEKVGETKISENRKPNVIVVQLESFFDPTRINYFECSEDPIPNWHYFESICTSGLYTVPTIGAGTVNTEYETLTGMSLRYFGAGEYPYKGILKEESCESSAFIMKQLGYTAFALHDNEANFYSRKIVYKNLGFDNFVSGEYMLNQSDTNYNGWMRDENLIDPIMNCLKSTEGKDYIFTVSVQPHGAYSTEQVYENPEITVDGENLTLEKKYQWEYYINQLKEEDQFIRDLVTAINNYKERTIILFYGDHLPTLDITDDELNEGNIYQTNYLIYDNFWLKQEDEDITSYQAFAFLLDKINIHEGNFFTFQQANMLEEDPNFIYNLQALQYDVLYGEKYLYSETGEFEANNDYKLGLYDPIITSIETLSDNIYYIRGENFTESCKVFVDGEMKETVFADEGLLLSLNTTVSEHSKIRIGVQSNSSTHRILSYSSYYYVDPLDDPDNIVLEEDLSLIEEEQQIED